ncbi:uncharacterized protein LOC141695098 [Apium graveolens]|uniref:uncharacterized protein LOC141695098 n=1 Tax=Apium graveolens TaxID=4045 RepID=UPI003D7B9121
MAFQLPTDLINQVQIAARNAAGLNGYNPDDPSLPCLPSFNASIFGLDPSAPHHLRCKICKAKLLRGQDSVICIFCGNQQINNDLPPDPISFTNTFGYQWLLHSLDLVQSETVGPATEESGSNRGHITPYQNTSLNHLLDLQITWPDELEMPETTLPHKTSEQSSSSFNLSGADLDDVLSGSKRDLNSDASVRPITEQQLDSVESKGSVQGNPWFSSDVNSADLAVKSFEDSQGDSHSGWAADFQSENKEESSNSYGSFVVSNVDLSSHIDSVFGAGKEEDRQKPADDLPPAQSVSHDWMQNDLWKNVDSKVSQQAVQFSSTAEAEDKISPNNYKIPDPKGVDWFEDNEWQKNITNEPSNKINDNPDAFDDWNDFASSSNVVNLSGDEPSNKIINKSDDSFTDWNDFASSSKSAVNLSGGEPSTKIVDKPDDSFDDWNDFASSSNVVNLSGDEPSDKIIEKLADSFDGWNDLPGSSNDVNLSGNVPSSKIIDKPDDSTDIWNDFASTSDFKDLSGNAWKDSNLQNSVSSEQTSDMNLFSSTVDIEDNEFGSFSRINFVSGLPGSYDGDAVTNNIFKEVHASERNNNEQDLVKELPEVPKTVGTSTEESELNKRHITLDQEASLNYVLDFNTTRLNELEMRDTTAPHKTPEQSSSSFNLSGADMDNVFLASKKNVDSESRSFNLSGADLDDVVSGSKKNVGSKAAAQPITEKQLEIESKGSISGFGSVQENLALFSDDHSAHLAVKSFEDNQRESLSEWPADFQLAYKDESFVASNIDLSSHLNVDSNASAQPVTEKQLDIESKGSISGFGSVQENLTLFSDDRSSDLAVKSFEDNQRESLSEWPADFQSAYKDESSKSYNSFVASNIDFSSHLDSVFGARKDENPRILEDILHAAQSVSRNWMQDGLWNNVDSNVSQQAVHFGSTAEAADGISPNNFKNPASEDVDWFEDNHWQKNITNNPSDKIIDKDADSSDDWTDFTSSSKAVNFAADETSNKIIGKPDDSFDGWNDFASSSKSVNLSGEPSSKIINKPDNFFDDWNNFASSSNSKKLSGDEPGNKIIKKHDDSSDDWTDFASSSNAFYSSGYEPSNKIIGKPDDSFGDWNDFATSSTALNSSGEEPSSKIIDRPGDSIDDWNDFASSSAVNLSGDEPRSKIINKPEDTFDDWNDFASSSNVVNLSRDEPGGKIINKLDDSFAGWNDFASSSQNLIFSGNDSSSKIIEKPGDPFYDWNDYASTK